MPEFSERLTSWRELQKSIGSCTECVSRWPAQVTRPLSLGEIPDPPGSIDILFVGVAPTPEQGFFKGAHFYSSARDMLRVGLFRLLATPDFGLPRFGGELRSGNQQFHDARCFFVHAAKVRPIKEAAPPREAIRFCASRHLRKEIIALQPRIVCFLGKNNATDVAKELFGQTIGEDLTRASFENWSGLAVVAPQPRRGWETRTLSVLKTIFRSRPPSI